MGDAKYKMQDDEDKMKIDLVLSGGGVKGQGVVGAVVALAEAGYKIQRVAGTSAGAITAALVAAFLKKERPMGELLDLMLELDNVRFADWSTPGRFAGPAHGAMELLRYGGLVKGDYLFEWLTPVLDDMGVRTFGDLPYDDPKSSLTEDQHFSLVLHVTDLSRRALVRLPWDYREYGLEPKNQRVVDAVRASMSIPLFFRPVRVESDRGPVTWLDGGVLSNFPLTVFDRTDGGEARFPTWGVRVAGARRKERMVRSALGVGLGLVSTISADWYRLSFGPQGAGRRTIEVNVPGVKTTQFDVDKKTITRIFDDGRAAGRAFLAVVNPASLAGPVPVSDLTG